MCKTIWLLASNGFSVTHTFGGPHNGNIPLIISDRTFHSSDFFP